ncbi:aerotolerance regulator BatA [Geothermobacter hydrogeniphilus]|uniref:Aerotolerance regulator BatA n=1 Tax=Geothermobacter hydrogeniphilus TaxID=1969733 RepID=A0A2K2HDD1_9BACT|nr:VWA domain-containing protein [Geothermobacter hydrogeniphilus]PNU21297.1 aerotolerance regulator BatA [Geothermobacter hydrogeniphilus]
MNLLWSNPLWLLLLPLALLPFRTGRRALTVSSLRVFQSRRPSWKLRLARMQPYLSALLLALLLILLAGPVLRRTTTSINREGIELMLVLDISASMTAADIPPDRMTVAREAAADFVVGRRNDRVGVILFAGTPFLLSPATGNRQQVAQRLRAVQAEQRGTGTAIGDALAAAADRLKDSRARSRAIILLTDGRSNRGRLAPTTASRAAAALGIRIYTIGFGTEQGAPLHFAARGPLPPGHPGRTRLATLDEPLLQAIAQQTGGQFFRATDADTLKQVYHQIDKLEKSPLKEQKINHDRSLAPLIRPWLAALLLLELLLFRGWLRRLP